MPQNVKQGEAGMNKLGPLMIAMGIGHAPVPVFAPWPLLK